MSRVSRADRIRYKLRCVSDKSRIRLSVFRSLRHTSVQAVNDLEGKTIASVSTSSKLFPKDLNSKSVEGAAWVGKEIAEALKKASVSAVYLDRGPYIYHGRIKAVAEAARQNGLDF